MGAACSKCLPDVIGNDLWLLGNCIKNRTSSSSVVTVSKQVMTRIFEYYSGPGRNNVPGDVADFFSSTLQRLRQLSKDPLITIKIPESVAIFIESVIADQATDWLPLKLSVIVVAAGAGVGAGIVGYNWWKGSSTVTENTGLPPPFNDSDNDSDAGGSTAPNTPANNKKTTIKGHKKKTSPTTAKTLKIVHTDDSDAGGSTAPNTPANNKRTTIKGHKKKTGPTTASNAASDDGSTPINSKKRSCTVILESNNRKKRLGNPVG